MICNKCGCQVGNDGYCSNCGDSIGNQNTSGVYNLTLTRTKSFVGCLVAFEIYIDGVLVDKIKNGEVKILRVSEGSHTISINKMNPVNVIINGDTTADVVVFAFGSFGVTNIVGPGTGDISASYVANNGDKTNYVLVLSIVLPILSYIISRFSKYYIAFWVYAIVIGYAIVNLAGLKNQKGVNNVTAIIIKNIIAIIISLISMVITFTIIF